MCTWLQHGPRTLFLLKSRKCVGYQVTSVYFHTVLLFKYYVTTRYFVLFCSFLLRHCFVGYILYTLIHTSVPIQLINLSVYRSTQTILSGGIVRTYKIVLECKNLNTVVETHLWSTKKVGRQLNWKCTFFILFPIK